jgi:hypothetical protein
MSLRGSLLLRHPRRVASRINRSVAYWRYNNSEEKNRYHRIAWNEGEDISKEAVEGLVKNKLKKSKTEEMCLRMVQSDKNEFWT